MLLPDRPVGRRLRPQGACLVGADDRPPPRRPSLFCARFFRRRRTQRDEAHPFRAAASSSSPLVSRAPLVTFCQASAQTNAAALKDDVVILALGARYQSYSANICRTFCIDPVPKARVVMCRDLLCVGRWCDLLVCVSRAKVVICCVGKWCRDWLVCVSRAKVMICCVWEGGVVICCCACRAPRS